MLEPNRHARAYPPVSMSREPMDVARLKTMLEDAQVMARAAADDLPISRTKSRVQNAQSLIGQVLADLVAISRRPA